MYLYLPFFSLTLAGRARFRHHKLSAVRCDSSDALMREDLQKQINGKNSVSHEKLGMTNIIIERYRTARQPFETFLFLRNYRERHAFPVSTLISVHGFSSINLSIIV